jgi:hypothetical protein
MHGRRAAQISALAKLVAQKAERRIFGLGYDKNLNSSPTKIIEG